MSAQSGKKSGGAKKIGRNGARCKIYRDRGVREKNKARKVRRHLNRFPNDLQAARWAA